MLGTVFAFIKQCYFKSVAIWSSVRRELIMWDALVPLVYQDLSLPWSPEIHCVDASEWGLGHCSATATVEEVKSAGRIAEKWRFDSELHSKARAASQMQELEGELLLPTIESSSSDHVFRSGSHDSQFQTSCHRSDVRAPARDNFYDYICQVDPSTRSQSNKVAFSPVPFSLIDRP